MGKRHFALGGHWPATFAARYEPITSALSGANAKRRILVKLRPYSGLLPTLLIPPPRRVRRYVHSQASSIGTGPGSQSLAQRKLDVVSVWWDLENCTLPSSRPSGESIIRTLRQYLQNLGRVGSCNAYFDLNQFSSIKLGAFRSLLHSSGISLIDCPHNRGKDVVDKRIIVDICVWAWDNPPPATVILIVGDKDYVHLASILSMRGYHVILIAPPQAHECLQDAQAAEVLTWPEDFIPVQKPPTKVAGFDLPIRSSKQLPEGGNYYFSAPRPKPSTVVQSENTATSQSGDPATSQPENTATIQSGDPLDTVPPHFQPLVEVLKNLTLEVGGPVPTSQLKLALAETHPGVYHKAGVKKYRAYMVMAQKADIVLIEKKLGLVTLHERFMCDRPSRMHFWKRISTWWHGSGSIE